MKNQLRKKSKGRFQRLAAVLLLTFGVMSADGMVSNRRAYGCSCIQSESASVERDRVAAVFAGTVSRITSVNNGYEVSFVVSEQWKGETANTIQIQTADNSAACGYNFELGESYLVYAYANDVAANPSDLSVGLCGRTSLAANAEEDIAELNEGSVAPRVEVESDAASGCR